MYAKFVNDLDRNEQLHRIDLPQLAVSSRTTRDVLSKMPHICYRGESPSTHSFPEGKRNRLEITHSLEILIVLTRLLEGAFTRSTPALFEGSDIVGESRNVQ